MDVLKHISLLHGEVEWPIWKRKVRDLLDYHEGALDAIDGKLVKPEPLESTATELERKEYKQRSDLYRKANSYAKSVITSAVTDAVYQKIMDKETAHDAWEALKQQFEATSKDQLFKICTDFFAFNWKSGDDVSTHIAKLSSLWNELNNGLRAKGENTLPDLMLVCKTLHILPSKFETFQSSWMLLTKDEEKTFSELTMQLCMFERNFTRNSDSKNLVQEALVANVEKQKQESKGKLNRLKSRKDDICNYCKKKGHWVRNCRQWIADGKPSKNKSSNAQSNTAVSGVALMSVCNEVHADEDPTAWWIDNGATKHVTNCPDFFVNFEKFGNPCSIKAAGKETLTALGRGTIQVLSSVKSVDQEITLNDVWYVPKISKNLFSVLAAQDRNQNSEFKSTAKECYLKVNSKVVLCGTREVHGTMYKANIIPIIPKYQTNINVAVADSSLLQLYHERWGHQDKRHIKIMLERKLGINVKLDKISCEPCIYGKAHRLPFGTRVKATKPGELMSADVCGPFDESFQKKRYLVVFKDSYTKFRYGYLIKEKSEVKNALKDMLAHAKTSGHSVRELLSDNGGEFDNEEVRTVLRAEGITQRLTAPYTPEQNGSSERENRTIIEMARTFKYSNPNVDFPEAMWAELVSTAIYILNRTGKSPIESVSPYELWIGKKPRIKHLRIIGSACYIHIPHEKRRKMDKKAIKGYLVGYNGEERYRIWVKEKHQIYVSRDVNFLERPSECEEHIKLPFQDTETEKSNSELDTEKYEEEANDEECETEIEDDNHISSSQELRDRSLLKIPKYLEDYVMTVEEIVTEIKTPETYEEALNSKQKADWKEAMNSEIISLRENHTWDLSPLPKDAKAIPCKWIFRIKTSPDGHVERYKARLVVKGYSQRQGVDYSQTFSPVAKLSTIRLMLSIAASEELYLTQFDVSTAFLYGELDEIIYMQQPEGYNDGTNRFCRLKRSLYGLKQAPRCWNKRFGGFLLKMGFKESKADPCLYIQEKNGRKILIVLYVDDGLVAASSQQDLGNFLEELKTEFKITTRPATYFLGLEIEDLRGDSIKISQKAYARKVLERFNFSECKPVSTPILKDSETSQTGKEVKKCDFPYRQAVGALMYLMVGTRPDLAYSVGFLSRSLENPSTEDVMKLKRVFRYLAGTTEKGIIYSNINKGVLECYSDADFGGCTKTGRSTSGVVVIYGGGAISWLSQRQQIVATSTTEAEIVAATEATKEIIWLSRLIREITELKHVPVLQIDNSATVKQAQNPEFHRRTKHISVKHFFIREKVTEGQLGVQQITSEQQVADIMTKPLAKGRLLILCNQMGLS